MLIFVPSRNSVGNSFGVVVHSLKTLLQMCLTLLAILRSGVIVIITLPLGLSAFEQRGCESSHSKYSLGLNPLKTTMTFRPECHGFHKSAFVMDIQGYDSMYKEEKRKRANAQRRSGARGGMPKKWTHLEFMTELVYDLIFPGQTAAHLSTIGELDDWSIDSTKSFSSISSVDEMQLEEEIDQHCHTGRRDY